VDSEGKIQIGSSLSRIIDKRVRFLQLEGKPLFFILDNDEQVIFTSPGQLPSHLLDTLNLPIEEGDRIQRIRFGKDRVEDFYLINRKIEYNQKPVGWVILLQPKIGFAKSKEQIQFLAIMLFSLALLGWGVIYLLTRKLSEPIKDVANAAKQIVVGNYDIRLEKDIKEKEIYELIQSFKDMAERLEKAEVMRTELLAGVTHELKTPVTSISALVQAVKDEVVTDSEAKEFLEICIKDTNYLQKMVEDLLDFNSFAVGDITVHKEVQSLNQLIQEITYQWKLVQEEESIQLKTSLPEHSIMAETDSVRVQQIMFNLLNNAKQAASREERMDVNLYEQDGEIHIDVKDNGIGIPEEEKFLIFEKFYRGKEKKHKMRGLGLGLPYSKMMAKALGGDLILKESKEEGTVFSLILKR
jgi:signal transduction histidine kinase